MKTIVKIHKLLQEVVVRCTKWSSSTNTIYQSQISEKSTTTLKGGHLQEFLQPLLDAIGEDASQFKGVKTLPPRSRLLLANKAGAIISGRNPSPC